MALDTPIDRGKGSRNGGTGTISTPSFTPAADSILLAIVFINSVAAVPDSISNHDGGSSWTQVGTTQEAGSRSASLWACHVGGSPSAASVSVAFSGSGSMGFLVAEVGGADVSGTVLNSFNSNNGANGYGTSMSTTLTAPSDLTMGFWCRRAGGTTTPENTSLGPGASFQYSDMNIVMSYSTSGDATPSASISGNRFWMCHAVDIKEAAGGPAPIDGSLSETLGVMTLDSSGSASGVAGIDATLSQTLGGLVLVSKPPSTNTGGVVGSVVSSVQTVGRQVVGEIVG